MSEIGLIIINLILFVAALGLTEVASLINGETKWQLLTAPPLVRPTP